MAQGERAARVAEQIQRAAATVFLEEADDPLLRSVTVTGVRVSPDLRHARIFFSGNPEQKTALEKRAKRFAPFLQRELAHRVRLRYAVEITLCYDEGLDNAMRLERIFEEIGVAKAEAADDADGDDDHGDDHDNERDPGAR
jgi:ribosome-binding factor A